MSHTPDSPLVSVIMPVLDPHPIYFREALDSILGQTLKDIEIIIVEDPSARSAKPAIEAIGDPRIRYFANEQRTSLVQQKNCALAEARSEFIAMQDADDISESDRLEKQLAFLTSHPAIDVLGTQIQIINSAGGSVGYRRYPQDHDSIVSAMRRFNPMAHPTVMLRKQVLLGNGSYQYSTHAVEDYELWSRLAQRGVRFSNHSEPLLKYRVHLEASKTRKLREMIRGTLEIKKMYWSKTMDARSRARMYMEYVLLVLPPQLVLNLFMKTQISDKLSES